MWYVPPIFCFLTELLCKIINFSNTILLYSYFSLISSLLLNLHGSHKKIVIYLVYDFVEKKINNLGLYVSLVLSKIALSPKVHAHFKLDLFCCGPELNKPFLKCNKIANSI
ncbi:Allatostatin B-like [Frankliniella occidentalis]|nr:Allatostatin B-like [Frankliniella occidentalis]